MGYLRRWWLLIVVLAGAGGLAGGAGFYERAPTPVAGPALSEPFRTYVQSPAYSQFVLARAAGVERSQPTSCADSRAVNHQVTTVPQPPVFGDAGVVTQGTWTERIEIDRCGKRAFANILAVASGTALPQMADLLPGTTRLDPTTQNDEQTLLTLYVAAKSTVPDCEDPQSLRVTDTEVVSETSAVKYDGKGHVVAGNWEELWTTRFCGKSVAIHLLMGPNEEGGFDVVWLKN